MTTTAFHYLFAPAVVVSPTSPVTTSPSAFLDQVRERVDARLREVLDETEAYTLGVAPDAVPMLRAARELTLRGGKRLRPALLFAAIECVEPGAYPDVATDLGAALELLQTYLLVHDDWMDDDPIRRGAPSVHVSLGRHYADPHLGACTAILAGDLMGALVHRVVGEIEIAPARRRAVVRAFGRMEHEVILGQCLDVTRSTDIPRIHQLKTGSYTVQGPLRLGAAVSGADESVFGVLEAFGTPLGVAFQLRDDLLGAFGSEAETGKPVGGDFREGKQTELVQHALRTLGAAECDELRGILGRRDATEAEVMRVRALVEASGAREHVEDMIRTLRERCLAALDSPLLLRGGRDLLASFATLLTDRRR